MISDELNTRVQLAAVLYVPLVPVPANPSLTGPPTSPYAPGSNTSGCCHPKRYDRLFLSLSV